LSKSELQKHSWKGQSGAKSHLKPIWSEKITVLSTFLESSLNFLSNDIKKTTKPGKVREKSGVKVGTDRNTDSKDSQEQNRL